MSVSKEYYKNLSAQEMSQDNFFIESITKPDEQSQNFWNDFLSEYPHCTTMIEEAAVFVRLMKFELTIPAGASREKIWDKDVDESRNPAVVNLARKRKWMWGAAAIAGVIVVSAFIWAMQGSNNIIALAQHGEVKKLKLPDQSVVTLNANSSLEYSNEWTSSVREVWLKGEAFFEVKHLAAGDKPINESDRFIVHTSGADIDVLGTTFNVCDRHQKIKVMVETGRVRVQFKNNNGAAVMMEPGDLVHYDQQSKLVVKEKVATHK